MQRETSRTIGKLLATVNRLPPEHQLRISTLVDLLLTAPDPAADRARRLIWSAIGASRVSASECLFQLDSAIEYLSRQRAIHRPTAVAEALTQ
jgi:hypothetical protein